MILNTKYHGSKEYTEEDLIFFRKGLPGFENCTKFILFTLEGNDQFSILHSIEDISLGFVTISPFQVIKDYQFELLDDKRKELQIESEEDIIVMNTVTINSDIEKVTTNLKAPIIINIKSKLGEQIILSNEKYLLKHPIFKLETLSKE
jgi:flagellar assembly factor FliW